VGLTRICRQINKNIRDSRPTDDDIMLWGLSAASGSHWCGRSGQQLQPHRNGVGGTATNTASAPDLSKSCQDTVSHAWQNCTAVGDRPRLIVTEHVPVNNHSSLEAWPVGVRLATNMTEAARRRHCSNQFGIRILVGPCVLTAPSCFVLCFWCSCLPPMTPMFKGKLAGFGSCKAQQTGRQHAQ
jgi:hypothetical protein